MLRKFTFDTTKRVYCNINNDKLVKVGLLKAQDVMGARLKFLNNKTVIYEKNDDKTILKVVTRSESSGNTKIIDKLDNRSAGGTGDFNLSLPVYSITDFDKKHIAVEVSREDYYKGLPGTKIFKNVADLKKVQQIEKDIARALSKDHKIWEKIDNHGKFNKVVPIADLLDK